MPLRESPERTPAFLAAHRANVRKSTGARTAEGKARGRPNGLKHGGRSALLTGFIRSMGLPPRLIKPRCITTRAPFERIGPLQMSLLRWWLAREWGPDSHRFYQFQRKATEQERQAAAADPTAGTPWAKLYRSFGAELCCELLRHVTSLARDNITIKITSAMFKNYRTKPLGV
jgi:hypothetical protein